VDEMLNFLYHIGGNSIDIQIRDQGDCIEVYFKSDFLPSEEARLFKMCKYLDVERNEQMESYYWELAGETESNQEFSLIGMMIDEYYLMVEDNHLELKLIRKI
jgi:hypothetical protein